MEIYTACLVVYCSGVGTIATMTALAAATLRANINIHSLLIAQAGLVSWERSQAQAAFVASVSYLSTCVHFC